jgi:putative ABC transport system permease protein
MAPPQDLVRAVRGLARRPGFSLAAILTLAVAIGANTAVFSVVDAVVLRPLPFPEPERLSFLTREGDVSIPAGRLAGQSTFEEIALFLRDGTSTSRERRLTRLRLSGGARFRI